MESNEQNKLSNKIELEAWVQADRSQRGEHGGDWKRLAREHIGRVCGHKQCGEGWGRGGARWRGADGK